MGSAKRFIKHLAAALVAVLFTLSLGGPEAWARPADGTGMEGSRRSVQDQVPPSQDIMKILSVLEERLQDGKMLKKAGEKLTTLHGKDLRLIASLCERIETGGRDAGADIAFLMAAMLVVLN